MHKRKRWESLSRLYKYDNGPFIQKAFSELIALADDNLHVGIPNDKLVVKILASAIDVLSKPSTKMNVQSTQGIVSVHLILATCSTKN